ncbi:NmrA family NAD(P)-binding protein [Sphingomonas sp. SUN019]|uniref:NmrA family NAD(P)-binding protein n=1 Tax=Sphingomonas sp. SUN019 TaxID=2937788 RepID=UPI0021649FAF|nr:NmrA family NAD(P)-binding protein [Sphingomonas sp. SUN019]UVO49669.1 NmrA family NAD(P)-binding protein [Sphingomonas sp. SUN019]
MALPKILVTGATGKTGQAVVDLLLDKGFPVRALVRARDARSAALDRRGVETVIADIFDANQMADALRSVQRAYYLPVFHTHMIQASAAFAIAAREAKLEAVVQMSQWLSQPSHPATMTRQTWLTDQLFAALPDTAHIIVNPGMFADNFLRVFDFAALLGIFPVLTGAGRAAPVSNEDMARVVAALLMKPDRHAGMRYRPTGPELLSGRDMAGIVAKVVEHRLVTLNLPFWMFCKVARQQRIDPLEISGFRYYVEEMKRGTFALDGGVTDVVAELTGRPAESFETTALRYAATPFARQTLGNRMKAFLKFNLTPIYRGYDLDRWDRMKGFPAPSNPTLSIDDADWRAEHSAQNQSPPQPAFAPRAVRA